MPCALLEAVGSQGVDQSPDRGRPEAEVEATEPQIGEEPRRDDRREQEQVPGDDGAEGRFDGPEGKAEGPASDHRLRLDERLEAVRVLPGSPAVLELVPDEPEAVDGLEVVSG